MIVPLPFVLILLGLIVSAHTRVQATVAGAYLNIPVLGIVALAVVLALAAVLLVLARLLMQDGLRLRPRAAAL